MVIPAVVFGEDGAVLPGDQVAEPFQGGVEGYDGVWLFQHLRNLFILDIQAVIDHSGKQAALADRPQQFPLPDHGEVFHIVFLHQCKGLRHRLIRPERDQAFSAAARDEILECLDIEETPFHHPLIVISLTDIAAAMIVQDHHHEIAFF